MIDAETVDHAVANQGKDERVRLGEDRRILDAHRDEVVDVEEPAIVDLARAAAPVREAIVLRIEQRAEPLAAARTPA